MIKIDYIFEEVEDQDIEHILECHFCENTFHSSDKREEFLKIANTAGWRNAHSGHGDCNLMCPTCTTYKKIHITESDKEAPPDYFYRLTGES